MKTSIAIALIICGSALMVLPMVLWFFKGFPAHAFDDDMSLVFVLLPLAMGFIMVCGGWNCTKVAAASDEI